MPKVKMGSISTSLTVQETVAMVATVALADAGLVMTLSPPNPPRWVLTASAHDRSARALRAAEPVKVA